MPCPPSSGSGGGGPARDPSPPGARRPRARPSVRPSVRDHAKWPIFMLPAGRPPVPLEDDPHRPQRRQPGRSPGRFDSTVKDRSAGDAAVFTELSSPQRPAAAWCRPPPPRTGRVVPCARCRELTPLRTGLDCSLLRSSSTAARDAAAASRPGPARLVPPKAAATHASAVDDDTQLQ